MKTASTADSYTFAAAFDIPSLLRERLRAAKRRNPRFSLRAFAKQLGIDYSTLSQVLRSRRGLSARALEAIGKRIGLSEQAIRTYAQSLKKKPRPKNLPAAIRKIHLDLDTFHLLSVWYHCAILELTRIREFRTDSRWIAKALGISVEDVNIAVQRLLRLGLLEMAGRNRWIDKSGDAEFRTAALTDAARARMNEEIHESALAAIRRIPSAYRAHRQALVALDSTQLSRLNRLADDFLQELRSLASDGGTKDDVYQVAIAIFPVTTLKKIPGDSNG